MMNLKFGWGDFKLILHDIEISNYILDNKSKDIELEYDKLETIKYSKSKRVLTAKAKYSAEWHDSLYLGLPENKEFDDNLINIEVIDFVLREQNNDDLKYGYCGYNKGDEELSMKDEVFVEVYTSTDIFNYIESLSRNHDIEFSISILKKGWYWIAPLGGSHLYLDTDNLESVLLNRIGSNKKISNLNIKKDTEEDTKDDDFKMNILQSNKDIFHKISELGTSLSSIKFTMWIIVIAIIVNIVKVF